MIKGSIQEQNIKILNIYVPNIGAPRCIQQTLTEIKGETDGNTIIVRDFNTPLTSMDRSPRQKINKATEILNGTIKRLDLIDMTSKKSEYTFSSIPETVPRTDHILGHKTKQI